jgi:hypothetical protein
MDENKLGHLEKYQGQLMQCQEKRCSNWPALALVSEMDIFEVAMIGDYSLISQAAIAYSR